MKCIAFKTKLSFEWQRLQCLVFLCDVTAAMLVPSTNSLGIGLAFPFVLVEKTHSLITWVKTLHSCKFYFHHSEKVSIAFQNAKRHILAWLFCFGSKQTLRFHGFTLEKDNLSCALPVDLKRWLDDKLKKPFNSDYCKSKLLIWPMKTSARNFINQWEVEVEWLHLCVLHGEIIFVLDP